MARSGGMALLEIRDLIKRFGGVSAIDRVNLDVGPGEIRGIIGPNGAGKTTLINLISGIYPPTAGTILLDGHSLIGLQPYQIARSGLLRSFQVCRLFGNMSVFENLMVSYFADPRSRQPAEATAQARQFLDLTRLAPLADRPAKSLSGGQRALLQIVCGFMATHLRCYVLDEPFAGINPTIKDSIVELIEQENRSHGTAFIIVSHEMAIVRRLCHRVTVMIEGHVLAEGTLDEVAAREDVIGAYLGRNWT